MKEEADRNDELLRYVPSFVKILLSTAMRGSVNLPIFKMPDGAILVVKQCSIDVIKNELVFHGEKRLSWHPPESASITLDLTNGMVTEHFVERYLKLGLMH